VDYQRVVAQTKRRAQAPRAKDDKDFQAVR
jgi:hypothetical protein